MKRSCVTASVTRGGDGGARERVDADGQRFDPALREALAAVPVGDPRMIGQVLQQTAPGYRFGGKLLRAARVTVGIQRPAAAPSPYRRPHALGSRR